MSPTQQHLLAWYGMFGCLGALVLLAVLVTILCTVAGNTDVPELVYGVALVLVIAGVIFLAGTG